MLVLHAGYYERKMYFWGETPFDAESEASVRKTGKGKVPRLSFGADSDTVANIIAETLYDSRVRKSPGTEVTVWLPTVGDRAVPSGPLINEASIAKAQVDLKPWRVQALEIGQENTISFLSACVEKDVLKSGIVIGADVRFWVRAIRFAGALVARQEYLPDLIKAGDEHKGIWEPIFLGTDARYLETLADAMPGACRAVTTDMDAKEPINKPRALKVTNFIVETVDYIARHAIYSQPQVTGAKSTGVKNSVHDHWLHALIDLESTLDVEEGKALELLKKQVAAWRRPISTASNAPFKLLLGLEEPKDAAPTGRRNQSDHTWYVHYYLQSTQDPSVLIPAEHVWRPTKDEQKILNRDGFDAKEFMLSALGKASAICHRIEESLRSEAPKGYELDTNAAFDFLTQRAVALEQAGFGVKTPDWWTAEGTRKKLGARAIINAPEEKKETYALNHMLDFSWEVTIDGEKVSRKELETLAKSKQPLVKMRGYWIHLKEDDLNIALALDEKKNSDNGSLRDVVQMALGSAKIPGDFEFEGVQATGWVNELIQQLEGDISFDELTTPDNFKGNLRAYQSRGYSWLYFLKQWCLGACLADDMGLGKTIQALALVQREWEEGLRRPHLVICPTSLTGNWQREASRFTPELPVIVHHGVNRNKGEAFRKEAEKQAIIISSYSILQRDVEIFKQIPWAGIILDEAQNIKNPKTKQSRAARSLKSDYKIAMTGTPIENNVGDLWAIMEFLNPGFLGSHGDFKRNYLLPIQANHESKAVEKLKRLTGPFILRRLKSDKSIIKDLPEKMEMKTYTNLTKEQAALYQALVNEVESGLDATTGMKRRGLVLSTLTKLKQICNHPAHYLGDGSEIAGRSGKLSRLTEMLEEVVSSDERSLVFTQFTEMGKIMQQHLQEVFGNEVFFLHGGLTKKKRDDMVQRFQEEEHAPHIFILSLKAGGTGLNLTRANHVFHYDRWWNPAVEEQATDRVYRIGQTKNVQIHKFLCAGTLEEKIDDMLFQKKDLAKAIIGAGENWLTELSTSDLKKLFELKSEAVSV